MIADNSRRLITKINQGTREIRRLGWNSWVDLPTTSASEKRSANAGRKKFRNCIEENINRSSAEWRIKINYYAICRGSILARHCSLENWQTARRTAKVEGAVKVDLKEAGWSVSGVGRFISHDRFNKRFPPFEWQSREPIFPSTLPPSQGGYSRTRIPHNHNSRVPRTSILPFASIVTHTSP